MKLHANATTTPRQRGYIQASELSVAELSAELGVSEVTVRRWRERPDTADRSSRPHRLATSLSPVEQAIGVELRVRLGLSLDDAVEVMRRCLRPGVSRSALNRLWCRHGINARPSPDRPAPPGRFEPQPFGYVHADLKHLPRLDGRPAYVLVVIERATRFVHLDVLADRRASTVAAAFARFLQAFAHPVHTVLTDNGSEFTDRFAAARYTRRTAGTGQHPFDRLCAGHRIVHKLTRPYHPQTNGMVERFNRRLAEALAHHPASGANAGRNRFASHDQRNSFLLAFADSYNRTRLKCLGYQAPAELLNNLAKQNTEAGMTNGGGRRRSRHPPLSRPRRRS